VAFIAAAPPGASPIPICSEDDGQPGGSGASAWVLIPPGVAVGVGVAVDAGVLVLAGGRVLVAGGGGVLVAVALADGGAVKTAVAVPVAVAVETAVGVRVGVAVAGATGVRRDFGRTVVCCRAACASWPVCDCSAGAACRAAACDDDAATPA
jgi:hypothetical protein